MSTAADPQVRSIIQKIFEGTTLQQSDTIGLKPLEIRLAKASSSFTEDQAAVRNHQSAASLLNASFTGSSSLTIRVDAHDIVVAYV